MIFFDRSLFRNILTSIFLCFILISVSQFKTYAGGKTIHGYVFDEFNEPLPFVNIYIEGSTRGTTSNFDGAFTLNLSQDTSLVLAFQYVGFKKHTITVLSDENPSPVKINLAIENIMLREVIITTRKEDPAYPLIREAIRNRKYYDDLVQTFAAQVYMKSNVKLDEIPESFFMIPKDQMPDSTQLGLIYLSESVSNYYFKKPDRRKEEMIASKISGTKTGYSFNRADMVMLSFYKNLVSIGLSERSFISPIANNALFYYKYRLIESFMDNDELIHKIQVIPKRKHDNVFKGYIYIANTKWNIHSLDLTITRNSQVDFTDSVYIRQVHVPVNNMIRMPLSLHIVMYFKAFGFKATTNFIGFFSNYQVNEAFPRNFFGNEVFAVKSESSDLDSLYWEENRQAVLTDEETLNYLKGDSIITYHESDEYLDSLRRVHNKFTIKKLFISGYGLRNKYRTTYYRLHPLTDAIKGYNTVEGFNLNVKQHFSKTWKKKNTHLSFNLATKYSFTNKNLLFEQNINYYFDRLHNQVLRLTFGKFNYDYNDYEALKPIQNTMRTLLFNDNFLKLYRKEFVKFETSREIFNGLDANAFIEYANRSPLVNQEDFVVFPDDDRAFISNNPQDESSDAPAFEANKALSVQLQLVFKFKQKFATYPNRKERHGSKYPILKLEYKKGLKTSYSAVDYDRWKIGLYDKFNFSNLGVSNVVIEVGGFWNNSEMYFMDFQHFYGNKTVLIPQYSNDVEIVTGSGEHTSEVSPVVFHSMGYYVNSTNGNYFSLHYEHHFNGWIINKIPLLRKTKMQVVAGINYLDTGAENNHTEYYAGLEHILKFLRIDFVGVSDGGKLNTQIKLGIGF